MARSQWPRATITSDGARKSRGSVALGGATGPSVRVSARLDGDLADILGAPFADPLDRLVGRLDGLLREGLERDGERGRERGAKEPCQESSRFTVRTAESWTV